MRANRLFDALRVSALAGFALTGCEGYVYDDASYFEERWYETYTNVHACAPTAHPRGGYYEVWVSPDGVAAFEAGDALPEGAVVLKAQWDDDSSCSSGCDLFTAMRKGPEGLAPDSEDWEWQTVWGHGEVRAEGQQALCIDCHAPAPGLLFTQP